MDTLTVGYFLVSVLEKVAKKRKYPTNPGRTDGGDYNIPFAFFFKKKRGDKYGKYEG